MSKHGDDRSERVIEFLREIERVEREHGLSLSHEDGHGAFMVEEFDEDYVEWLLGAADNT